MRPLNVALIEDCDVDAEMFERMVRLSRGRLKLEKRFNRGEDALDSPRLEKIDALLCDLSLPGMSGQELIRALRKKWRWLRIVAWTGCEEDRHSLIGEEQIEGYIVKSHCGPAEVQSLIGALDTIVSGGGYIDPRMHTEILRSRPRDAQRCKLSPQQRRVMVMAGQGIPDKGIAAALGITAGMVCQHKEAARAKVGAETTNEAIAVFGVR